MNIESIIELVNQYKNLEQRISNITAKLNSYNANKFNYDLLITFESCSQNYDDIYFRSIISEKDMMALITKKKEMLEAELEEIKRKLEGIRTDTSTYNEDKELNK